MTALAYVDTEQRGLLGDAYNHYFLWLKAVVDGEQGGKSKTMGWKGGDGFRFFELTPSIL